MSVLISKTAPPAPVWVFFLNMMITHWDVKVFIKDDQTSALQRPAC